VGETLHGNVIKVSFIEAMFGRNRYNEVCKLPLHGVLKTSALQSLAENNQLLLPKRRS